MPIFEYQALEVGSCAHCASGFERFRKSSDPEVSKCPECGEPVQRIASAPSLANSNPSLDPKNIEQHGFTQYRKSGSGTYEKTAGKGPRTITKD